MVHQSNSQINRVLSMLPPEAKIADLGAGGRKITPDTITMDFAKLDQTSVIADIHSLPVKNESFDCVFCTGTLEHVKYPETVVREIERTLKSSGVVYIDVPFMQCYHPDPEDYWRFTVKGLELLCRRNGLFAMETGTNIGSASSLTWVMSSFVESILPSGRVGKIISRIFSYCIFPVKYLDRFTVNGKNHYIAPSAVYLIGRKNE